MQTFYTDMHAWADIIHQPGKLELLNYSFQVYFAYFLKAISKRLFPGSVHYWDRPIWKLLFPLNYIERYGSNGRKAVHTSAVNWSFRLPAFEILDQRITCKTNRSATALRFQNMIWSLFSFLPWWFRLGATTTFENMALFILHASVCRRIGGNVSIISRFCNP